MSHNINRQTDYPTYVGKCSPKKKKFNFAFVSIILGIVILWICTTHTNYTVWKIKTDPVETTATVYDDFKHGNGDHFRYKFTVDGVTYHGYAVAGCKVGDTISILYYRKDPSKNFSVNNGVRISF